MTGLVADTTQPASASANPLALKSAIYAGELYHLRSRPKRNEFRYGIYFLYVDIDRLDELAGSLTEFGHNAKALASI